MPTYYRDLLLRILHIPITANKSCGVDDISSCPPSLATSEHHTPRGWALLLYEMCATATTTAAPPSCIGVAAAVAVVKQRWRRAAVKQRLTRHHACA